MKKIMFNDRYGLTDAVLEGRKTVTRRNLTLTLHKEIDDKLVEVFPSKIFIEDERWKFVYDGMVFHLPKENYPLYKIGEIIAIAERYCDEYEKIQEMKNDKLYSLIKEKGWNNKMFVKSDLMPHHIKITNIRIEKLQNISDEDCIKEGVEFHQKQYEENGIREYCVCGLKHWRAIGCYAYSTPKEAFSVLIDKIYGKGTWENNPFVWVYEFVYW